LPEPPKIITLLTDFGTEDPYAGILKGVILSINPFVTIVDITHGVQPQDVGEAAYLIPEYFPLFPPGTVHVSIVDPTVGSSRRAIAGKAGGHLFVGPDNGIFSFLFQGSWEAYAITDRAYALNEISSTFHGRDIFAPAAAHLSMGLAIERLGKRIEDPLVLQGLLPEVQKDILYGRIVRFDRFGNAITNIALEPLLAFTGGRPFRITVGKLTFDRISSAYYEGKAVCLAGSNGYLEFAYFRGSFSEECSAWKGDEVTVRLL
jgi:S-adenosyl-L-methionine hydrolase (adenosine-forming)